MRTIKFLTVAAFCAAVATSCTVGSENMDYTPKSEELRAVVKFGSKNISAMQTKVENDQWAGGDEIGVFMVENGTSTISENSANIPYAAATSGTTTTFSPLGTDRLYYPVLEDPKVGFIAYHPYVAAQTDFTYSIDLSDQSNQSAIDLLTAHDNIGLGYDKNNTSPIDLQFVHQLVKIIIKVTAPADGGVDPSELTGMTVDITQQVAEGTFDLSSIGNVVVLPPLPTPTVLTTNFNTSEDYYEAIVMPANNGALVPKFIFSTSEATYECTVPSSSWLKNNKYIYDVELERNGVQISGTVYDWGTTNSENTTGYPQ